MCLTFDMHITVNGLKLFFDVEGAKLVPDGPRMRERPTVVMLHGGPGADHSHYRPAWAPLAEVAQVIYYDHRGNGRSEHGPQAQWNLAQWAEDLHVFCQTLGIQRPVIQGTSFGGMVALTYATRYPQDLSKLILISTAARGGAHTDRRVAMFEQLGGKAAGDLARRRLLDGDTSPDVLADWLRVCLPLYNQRAFDVGMLSRGVGHPEVTRWFSRAEGEGNHFDLRADLHRIECPTLLMGGVLDPMLPIENQRDMAALILPHLLCYHEFEHAGHGVVADAPEQAWPLIREFVLA
jgi:pimeloyl-ACP methyl ester carboxylesterase